MRLFRYHHAIDPKYNDVKYLSEKIVDGETLLDFRASFENHNWNELIFNSDVEIKQFIKKHFTNRDMHIFRDALISIRDNQIEYFCEVENE